MSWSTQSSIGGNLWTPGNVSSSNSSVVRGDLRLGGTLSESGTFTVDGNAYVVKTLPSNAKVLGKVNKVSSVAAPCNCSNQVPTASMTAAHRAPNNDDATIGLSATALVGNNPAKVDLPCGNYYLSQINAAQPLTIAVHGHTALYVDGNLQASQTLAFQIDPSATLDMFVAGTFSAAQSLVLGSASNPEHCRLFVAGSHFAVSGNATYGCNVYAPNALMTLANNAVVSGSIVANNIQVSGNATVHYDTSILNAGNECCTASSCDDGNPCTLDSCNGDGTCTHAPATNGIACTGSNKCEETYTCQAGVCAGSNPVVCTGQDSCHVAGTCDPSTGICSNPAAANGTSCSDGNACTQTDSCQNGKCTGSSPVTCTASDACHVAGTCNTATGACSNPVAANGTSCSDGNACTQSDSCQNGTCTGGNPVTCAVSDACHAAGTCDPTSGACSNPVAANGTSCSDGNACTKTDTCQSGLCTGSNPVTCVASDSCHTAGTCNTATGACSNPVAANGTSCSDGNACTQNDSCQNGTCTGSNPVTCTASDSCHTAGTCNTATGACSNPVAANGTSCSDGNACTQNDTCQNGTCTGSSPVTCTASDSCHTAGTCNTATGACSNPIAANGTSCSDGNACTQNDTCQNGTCASGSAIVCTAKDACHTAGTCDPSTGACSTPVAANGTSCDDGNACTQSDSCQSGTCTGSSPVACAASDACHAAGVCNPATGVCSNPAAADGTVCAGTNKCNQTYECIGGTCTGSNPVACVASDACHLAGTCDPATGCSNPTAPNGTTCNDGNACTQNDLCTNGACTGSPSCVDSGTADSGTTEQPPQWPQGAVLAAASVGPTSALLSWTAATDPVGVTEYSIFENGAGVGTVDGSKRTYVVTGLATGSSYAFAVQAQNGSGAVTTNGPTTTFIAQVPNPATVAPAIDTTVATTVAAAAAFLYSGSDPIQAGLTTAIDPQRVVVLQGRVIDRNGNPLLGVAVTVADHPEFGHTSTRADGHYDLVVNGGGTIALSFDLVGMMHAERTQKLKWADFAHFPDVALVPQDSQVSVVDLTGSAPIQVGRANAVQDADGSRQTTLMLAAGTTAQMSLPGNQTQALDTAHVRATEYTVGPNGPAAMPGVLPATSGYTFAVALTVDEAEQANATQVWFSKPVAVYLENFLNENVGTVMPAGYYDKTSHVWVASTDGRVVRVLSITGGNASLDIDGSGQPATPMALDALGVSSDELGQLASLYSAGQTLWRVPVQHFSDWDFNQGTAPPNGSAPPNGNPPGVPTPSPPPGGPPPPGNPPPVPPPCVGACPGPPVPSNGGNSSCQPTANGCIVEVADQVLGERVAVGGTPFTLNYRSNRTTGYTDNNTIAIPLTGPTPPAPLVSVALEVDIAGQQFTQSFGPAPNQKYQYTWNNQDGYGRAVQGTQPVTVRVGYVYNTVYLAPSDNPDSNQYNQEFGHYTYYGAPATTTPDHRQITLWYEWDGQIGKWATNAAGIKDLGGWTLSEHHFYDPTSNELFFGDGRIRLADTLPPIITTIAGTGTSGTSATDGDNGLATSANLNCPSALAVAADGTFYTSDPAYETVRMVTPDGIIHPFLSRGAFGTGPQQPSALAIGPDGYLYVGDGAQGVVWRVDPTGHPTVFAGTPTLGARGDDTHIDGFPATSVSLGVIWAVTAAADGSVYVGEYCSEQDCTSGYRLLRVGTDGYLRIVAQSPLSPPSQAAPSAGPLSGAYFYPLGGFDSEGTASGLAIGPEGSVYLSDVSSYVGNGWSFLRRIGTDGTFSTVAGDGNSPGYYSSYGYNPTLQNLLLSPRTSGDGSDGLSAMSVSARPANIAVAPDGTIVFTEPSAGSVSTPTNTSFVKMIRPDGVISTLAGNADAVSLTGTPLLGDGQATTSGLNLTSTDGLAVLPDSTILVSECNRSRIRRIHPPVMGSTATGYTVADETGASIYTFDGQGRHLTTVNAFTGVVQYRFAYDAAGRLATITDVNGNVTSISRDAGGNPAAIVGPFGQTTSLTVDANGLLATIVDAVGDAYTYRYATNGLLQTTVTPRGGQYQYTYDSNGRLLEDVDPAGGGATLSNAATAYGNAVTRTTAMGVATNYELDNLASGQVQAVATDSAGFQTIVLRGANGQNTVTSPDGTQTFGAFSADPRFGPQAPIPSLVTIETPDGIRATLAQTRSVTLSDPSNLLSVQTATTTQVLNGNAWTTLFNAGQSTSVLTSPTGRTITTTLDAKGQPTQVAVPGMAPLTFSYNSHGDVVSTARGSIALALSYDASGHLESTTDGLGHVVSYTNDPLGRPIQVALQDSRRIGATYDSNSNTTGITLPSNASHLISYTPVDLAASYTPPSLNSASPSTLYSYDLDRALQSITRPDGVAVTYAYVPVRSLMGPAGRSFSQGHGTPPFAGRRDHPRGRGEEFFAASWDQPICRGKGPAVPAPRAGHESSDREVSQGSFRRRRGSPSGGAHALPGADDDRHQRGAAPLVGAAESSPHRA